MTTSAAKLLEECVAELHTAIVQMTASDDKIICDHVKNVHAKLNEAICALPDADGWQPIETAPEGEHIMLYWPEGEKGVGGIECATIYKTDYWALTGYDYWTHGGPNAGLDWEPRNSEKPTHWHPLPKPPETRG